MLLASPAAPAATDLLTVLAAAENRDPQFREAEARALAVAEGIPQARASLFFPTLVLNAGVSRVVQDIENEQAFGAGGNVSFSTENFRLNMTQPVWRYDRWIALRQADERLQQAQFDVLFARQDLMVRTAERYFDVLAALDNLAFAKAEMQSLESQLDQASQRFEVGLIAITDVQEAQAGFDRAVAAEIAARNQLENAHEALREITEAYHPDLVPLGGSMPLAVPEPADIDAWTQTALEGNYQLASARVAADVAKREIRRQYAQHLPTLDLVGGHGFNKQGGRFGSTEVTQSDIGLELSVPVFEGGRTVSLTRQAGHEHTVALEQLEQTRRTVQRQAREAYLGVLNQLSSVKALKQAVVSSRTALESTRAGFEVGTRTAIDVVAAERGLSQSLRDYARARYDYILETLRLKRAAGSLQPGDIAAANAWLDEGVPAGTVTP